MLLVDYLVYIQQNLGNYTDFSHNIQNIIFTKAIPIFIHKKNNIYTDESTIWLVISK